MSLCFQSWIEVRLAFIVSCFPCCVFGLVLVLVVFHACDRPPMCITYIKFVGFVIPPIMENIPGVELVVP
jgi:hypothetical protein